LSRFSFRIYVSPKIFRVPQVEDQQFNACNFLSRWPLSRLFIGPEMNVIFSSRTTFTFHWLLGIIAQKKELSIVTVVVISKCRLITNISVVLIGIFFDVIRVDYIINWEVVILQCCIVRVIMLIISQSTPLWYKHTIRLYALDVSAYCCHRQEQSLLRISAVTPYID
jgi:hypothetical protein